VSELPAWIWESFTPLALALVAVLAFARGWIVPGPVHQLEVERGARAAADNARLIEILYAVTGKGRPS